MSQNDTFIMVCAHKPGAFLSHPPYVPIHAGKAIASVEIPGTIGDDTGDHISARNPWYCELTAQYWAWKNLPKSVKYVGLCHYRRYFDFKRRHLAWEEQTGASTFFSSEHPLPDLDRLFRRYDMVMAKPSILSQTLIRGCYWMDEAAFMDTRTVIADKYPDYVKDFERMVLRGNRFWGRNMFVMPRAQFDAYCEWSFGLYFEIERRFESSGREMSLRLPAFLGEYLLAVWARVNGLRVCYRPIRLISESDPAPVGKIKRMTKRYVIPPLKELLFRLRQAQLLPQPRPGIGSKIMRYLGGA